MITTCTVCQARYQLDAERIPPRVIKVRCPSCSGVFTLDGTQVAREVPQEKPFTVTTGFGGHDRQPEPRPQAPAAPEAPAQPAADVERTYESTPEPAPAPEPVVAKTPEVQTPEVEAPETVTASADDPGTETPAMDPGVETPAAAETEVEQVAETGTATAVMDEPAPASPRRRKSKEEMLARALVSDIMVYNRELYDTAKAENNLLEALGAEIKKSWELYKDKVGEDVANDTDHFRNALNEILADGEKIF